MRKTSQATQIGGHLTTSNNAAGRIHKLVQKKGSLAKSVSTNLTNFQSTGLQKQPSLTKTSQLLKKDQRK